MLKKNASVAASRALPHISSPLVIMSDAMCSKARNGLSGLTGRRSLRTVSAQSATGRMNGFSIREHLEAQAVRMTAPHQLRARFRHHGAHCRPHQSAVHALSDFRNAGGRSESKVVLGAIAADLANVVELAGLETEQVVALHQLGIFDRFVDTRDHRLVKPGRHQVDHVHGIGKFLVLLGRHLSRRRRCRDAQCSDASNRRSSGRL